METASSHPSPGRSPGSGTPEDERELLLRAKNGDRDAFGALVERHMRRAYFAALGLVGSHEEALDLSQEAFVRAYRARAGLDPERPFYPWLYRTLRRLCFNFLRDREGRREKLEREAGWLVDEVRGSAGEPPDRAAERSELRARLEAAIAELPPKERETLVLREFDGRTYREVAELLEVPIGTVMSRLYRARRRLAQRLGGAP